MSEAAIRVGKPAGVPRRAVDRLQSSRGLACLLLVVFHVVGGKPDDGLRIADGSAIRQLLDILLYLRMPMFAFISGTVYALKPLDPAAPVPFVQGKLRRLGLPVLSATTIFFAVAWLRDPQPAATTVAALLHAYVFAYEIFWFLQAMLLIFMIMPLLEQSALRTRWGAAALILISFALTQPAEPVDFLSINGALFLAPFFLFGVAAQRYIRLDRRLTIVLGGVLAAAVVLHIVNVLTLPAHMGARRGTWLSLLIGTIAPLLIITYGPRNALLARIGDASFAIFLFHIFFVVAARLVLQRLGVESLLLHFAAGMIAGVSGPMVLERLIVRSASARRWLLGLR